MAAYDLKPLAARRFLERYQSMWVAGKVHWCSRRTMKAICDKDFKGISLADKGQEVTCVACQKLGELKLRVYAKELLKLYQGGLGI